jgi:outer membrane receptor for monomeric catechols
VTSSTGEGICEQFVIRGFSAPRYLCGRYARWRNSFRDTFNLEQVEVLKGPGSGVLYGRGSAGGSINLVSKRHTRRQTDLAASLGSYDTSTPEPRRQPAAERSAPGAHQC